MSDYEKIPLVKQLKRWKDAVAEGILKGKYVWI